MAFTIGNLRFTILTRRGHHKSSITNRKLKKAFAIRALTIADYEAVMRLWKQTEGIGLNESDSRARLTAFLKRNPRLSRVAADGDKIVGAILCGHDGRRGYLHHLAVAGAHRHLGIGRKLVEACLSDLAKLNIIKCNIFLLANNSDGEAFWKHNGWNRRADLQVMQKHLGGAEPESRGC